MSDPSQDARYIAGTNVYRVEGAIKDLCDLGIASADSGLSYRPHCLMFCLLFVPLARWSAFLLELLLKWMLIRTKIPVAQIAVTMVAMSARIERTSRMVVSGWWAERPNSGG